jgi:hypothetical protein
MLEKLGRPECRVLAGICLLGPQRSATRGLSIVTGLSPAQVLRALEVLDTLGAISRTRWSTPPTGGTELPATWWPRPAWHAVLGLAMDIAELAEGFEERLKAQERPTTLQSEKGHGPA